MKLKFSYLLWLLLIMFGSLFVIGSLYETVNRTDFPTKGLWGNLFASMIAVLLIEKLVRKTEMQESERPIRYVKRRIASICYSLLYGMKPPTGWRERLDKPKLNWKKYFDRVMEYRTWNLRYLETLLERYGHLIDPPELRNDVFDIVGLLSKGTWFGLAEPTRSSGDKLWRLRNFANLASAVISKSMETIKCYNLLETIDPSIPFEKGQPSEIQYSYKPKNIVERQLQDYDKIVKDAINFRDACQEKTSL